jgi:ribosomal protein L7/L12/DNA-binding beta-propeller fold protein YncE
MCAAPLDYDGVSTTVRCPYCTNTVIAPEEWRSGGGASTPIEFNAGRSLGDLVNQAVRMAEVAKLARAGEKIQAIKLYRELTGLGLAESKDAVERIERGEPLAMQQTSFGGFTVPVNSDQHSVVLGQVKELVRNGQKIEAIKLLRQAFGVGLKEAKEAADDIETGRPIALMQTGSGTQILRPGAAVADLGAFAAKEAPKAAKGCGAGVLVVVVFVALVFAFVGFIVFKTLPRTLVPKSVPNAKPTNAFAHEVLSFGEEGMGPGQFQDARNITVDGDEHIFVAEYQGGRVQVFDASGKYLSQFMGDPKAVIMAMAADRKGNVYLVHPGRIERYNGMTGERLGDVSNLNGFTREDYSAAAVALDGTLYAVGSNSNIIRISPTGAVSTAVNIQQQAGSDTDLDQIAVDGSGNIFGLDTRAHLVLKFGPDGKFLTRFGGRGKTSGLLNSPFTLAVDRQGRVYVSDASRAIQVFDGTGRWLADAGPTGAVIFGMAFTSTNDLLICSRNEHKVRKYKIDK